MNVLGFLNPRRISGQIAGLVLISIIAIHLVVTTLFLINRPDEAASSANRHWDQLSTLIQLIAETSPTERPQMIANISRLFPAFGISAANDNLRPSDEHLSSSTHDLGRRLGDRYRVRAFQNAPPDQAAIMLPDGARILVHVPPEHGWRPFWGGPGMLTLLFVVTSLTLLGMWAARMLAAPLSSFADAAESFSLDTMGASLPEKGPEEIRSAARAFNRMRQRIVTLIDDRTRMLAAISHDLRTPITRLRLRSEFIEDEAHRDNMLRDLDQMRSMLESVLSFLRNDRTHEIFTLTDIASILQLIADQFSDLGQMVIYQGPSHAMMTSRPDDLQRAVTNIVENAVRFGGDATIRLSASDSSMMIEVEDSGPGISDSHKDAVLEPFVRGDVARNMNSDAGFGLGLSIARAIILSHGGELSLHDRSPHGLLVRVLLPVQQMQTKAA